MTTYTGKRNEIQFSLNNDIYRVLHPDGSGTYKIILPTVVCTNYEYAEKIQNIVNILVAQMSKALIESE